MIEKDIRAKFKGIQIKDGQLKEKIGEAFEKALKCYADAYEKVRAMPGYQELLKVEENRPAVLRQPSAKNDMGLTKLMRHAELAQEKVASMLASEWEDAVPEKVVCENPRRLLQHPKKDAPRNGSTRRFIPVQSQSARARKDGEKL